MAEARGCLEQLGLAQTTLEEVITEEANSLLRALEKAK
jgi:hypothetical protein